jgi:hypothetical protein
MDLGFFITISIPMSQKKNPGSINPGLILHLSSKFFCFNDPF